MAIVEDEVRNESEEENEIEVVVEEDDAEQDSDESEDENEDALELKVLGLEMRIANDPYVYEEHIELIEALQALSELDRWRAAFDRLQSLTMLHPEHWLLRLQTEVTVGHSAKSRDLIAKKFKEACLDCYSIPIFTEWCSWASSIQNDIPFAREQLHEVLKRTGADPLSGKIFWDVLFEFEKGLLNNMSETDEDYANQKSRVVFSLEEMVSRPMLRGEEALAVLAEMTAEKRPEYMAKMRERQAAAAEYLQKITIYEDKLLTTESNEEKYNIYLQYIDAVKDLSTYDKYRECDSNSILKSVYCRALDVGHNTRELLESYQRHSRRYSSRATHGEVLDKCCRHLPRDPTYWIMRMQHAESYKADFNEVKSIFETALSKGMETFKDTERLWMAYLEYTRRSVSFEKDHNAVDKLRRTFRLAWDSLAETWGQEANDSEVPLYWARLEYRCIMDPKQGKEIFEEIFKCGENKTMSKYWEQLIHLEMHRSPPISQNKLRDLFKRALKFVQDYPPSVARLWLDYERDMGDLNSVRDCIEISDKKLQEWKDNYQTLKEKMTGKKNKKFENEKPSKNKGKQTVKSDKNDQSSKGKRKITSDDEDENDVKRKKDGELETEVKDKHSKKSLKKRPHEDEVTEGPKEKRARSDSASSGPSSSGREACTLFVSNLEFKVDEEKLRKKLSEYGEIVSLRVKAGVKAFGGSICYCQYKNKEAVDEAIKHDRTPLDGRPMFLSRYSAGKSSKTFKYATTAEKNKLFVKNLPFATCTKEALTEIFEKYGKLNDVRVVTFKDGKPKGLAYIDFEDAASAAKALEATNGMTVADRKIEVLISAPPPRAEPGTSSLGQPKREITGGMRRTQLSQFIPSVLQKPSTSKAPDSTQSNAEEKKPMSNSDFRNMLLNKK